MALKIITTPTFAKVVKKLHDKDKKAVDDAVREILVKPTIGEPKKGDLLGVSVYKFKINKQEILLSYSVGTEELLLIALDSVVTRFQPIRRCSEYEQQQGTRRYISHSASQFPAIA